MKTARKKKITGAQIGKTAVAKLLGNSSCSTCACLYATARAEAPPSGHHNRDSFRWGMPQKQVLHCASHMFEPNMTNDPGWTADRTKTKAPDNRCVHYHPTTGKSLDVINEDVGNMLARNNDCIPARIRRVIDAKAMEHYKAAKARDQKTE